VELNILHYNKQENINPSYRRKHSIQGAILYGFERVVEPLTMIVDGITSSGGRRTKGVQFIEKICGQILETH